MRREAAGQGGRLHKITGKGGKLSAGGAQQRPSLSGREKHFSKMKAALQMILVKMHKFGRFSTTFRRKCNKKIVAKRGDGCYNTTNIFPWRTSVRRRRYNFIIP